MGLKVGEAGVPLSVSGAGSPSNIMSPGASSISVPSGILIYPAVWPQQTNVTNRQDRQRSDSIGRTVLQTVAVTPASPTFRPMSIVPNGRPSQQLLSSCSVGKTPGIINPAYASDIGKYAYTMRMTTNIHDCYVTAISERTISS